MSACGSGNPSRPVVTPAAKLNTITIDPVHPSVAKGTSVPVTATGNYSNGTTRNLTSSVRWSSSDGAIAKIST
ncbi:MAG: Ig-like domain-containing protein [Candidatus Binataceae bacterium]